MRRCPTLVTALCLASVVSSVFAGPWTRKQGTGFVQLGFSTIGYNKVYNDRSEKQPLSVDVRDNVLQLLGEYGFTDHLTASAAVPFKFLSVDGTTASRTNSGVGDIDLGLKYNWLNANGFVLSSEALFGLPVGSTTNTDGLRLGDGEFNVTARMLAGKSFFPTPLYVSADLGFNFRTNNFSHDVPFNIEAGYGLLDNRLYVILLIAGRESLSNKATLGSNPSAAELSAAGLGLYGNNLEFLAIVPKVFFRIDERWAIAASYATAVHGRNVAGGIVLAGGIAHEF